MSQNEPQTHKREKHINLVTEDEAEGKAAEVYREIKESRDGKLEEDLSLSKMWYMLGNDPGLAEIVWEHMYYGYNEGSLPFELKSKISMVVATVMECEGCQFYHESALEELGADAEDIEALNNLEINEVGFSPSEEVILKFSQKATEDPHAITDEDLQALRDLGLSEKEILEVIDCISLHVYSAYIQGIAGIVYPGMDKEEWTSIDD